MIDFNKSVVIIPARKGSKGIPGKNKKLFNGNPLIQYTIDVALSIFPNDAICISTDDSDIQQIGLQNGLSTPSLRPDYLSDDKASARDVILYEIQKIGKEVDTIIYLQPTSPLRTEQNLKEAINLYQMDSIDMLVSVSEAKANPYFNLFEENEEKNLVISKMHHSKSRQDAPAVYQFNGAIYIINARSIEKGEISEFLKIKKYVMSQSESIDIDNEFDWFIAEQLIKLR